MLKALLVAAALAFVPALALADPVATSQVIAVSSTPAVTAGAYASGAVVGGAQAVNVQASKGLIQNAVIDFNSGAVASQTDILVLNAAPTGGGVTDNVTVALAAVDMPKVIGVIHVSDCTVTGTGTAVCQALGQALSYAVAGRTLWLVPVIRGAATFTGTSDVTLTLYIVQ